MDYEFRLQDPTTPSTTYLYEALIEAIDHAESCRWVFSFATRDGVDLLLLDPAVVSFLSRGSLSLVVGIDAITNRHTLERLQELERQYSNLVVRVFWNRTAGLFHPKFAHFRYRDGRQALIVGSGNLTPHGLRHNFEAYSVLRVDRRERLNLLRLEEFLTRHASDIRIIDEEILVRAAKNVNRGGRRRRAIAADVVVAEEAIPPGAVTEGALTDIRVLVAQIPKAGGRWHQVHFNEDVTEQFFRVRPNTVQRVFLRERRSDDTLGPLEPPRPCVMSGVNKNRKIELAARREEAYPTVGTPPIGVFRELQVRTFEYILLMPGEPGHSEMLRFTETQPRVGKGLPRVITTADVILRAWPGCPLFR